MTRTEICIECQHFVPVEKIKLHDLIVETQKVANQEMQIPTHWTVERLLKTIESLTIGR